LTFFNNNTTTRTTTTILIIIEAGETDRANVKISRSGTFQPLLEVMSWDAWLGLEDG